MVVVVGLSGVGCVCVGRGWVVVAVAGLGGIGRGWGWVGWECMWLCAGEVRGVDDGGWCLGSGVVAWVRRVRVGVGGKSGGVKKKGMVVVVKTNREETTFLIAYSQTWCANIEII